MKKDNFNIKRTVIMGATALAVMASPLIMTAYSPIASLGLISVAHADEHESAGQKGAGYKGKGSGDEHGQGSLDARKGMDKVLEADEDSDRPAWAGGNPTENPHSGGGEGKPDQAGTMKGDDYGDLIVLKRDPITGVPVTVTVNDVEEYLICLDVACTETVPTIDGEIPEGVAAIEVDFGRAAVARSPSKVTDHALAEAIDKLTADGAVITQDLAGRITITVDGVTSTIDSPLENLALYIDLMVGLASDSTSDTEAALGSLATLDTAAALLAALADKTGDISIDFVFYNNIISNVVDSGDYYDYSSFTTYSRTYPEDYSYFYTLDGGVTILTATLNVNDYLDAINGEILPTDTGVTLFTTAADDALEIIELIHTQIHEEVLPGTVVVEP